MSLRRSASGFIGSSPFARAASLRIASSEIEQVHRARHDATSGRMDPRSADASAIRGPHITQARSRNRLASAQDANAQPAAAPSRSTWIRAARQHGRQPGSAPARIRAARQPTPSQSALDPRSTPARIRASAASAPAPRRQPPEFSSVTDSPAPKNCSALSGAAQRSRNAEARVTCCPVTPRASRSGCDL